MTEALLHQTSKIALVVIEEIMVRRQRGMLFTFIFYILFTFYTIACDSRALRPEPQKQSLSIECIVVVEEKCMSGLNILF